MFNWFKKEKTFASFGGSGGGSFTGARPAGGAGGTGFVAVRYLT